MSIPAEPGYYWLTLRPELEPVVAMRWVNIVVLAHGQASTFPVDAFMPIYPDAQWGPRIDPPKEEKR